MWDVYPMSQTDETSVTVATSPVDFRRGDVVHMSGSCVTSSLKGSLYVWKATPHTLTLAKGWRVWYLRLIYNPAKRAWEAVRDAWDRMWRGEP